MLPLLLDCTYLSLAARDWQEIMGSLSAELLIVLAEVRYAISRTDLPVVPVFFKNHKSWEEIPGKSRILLFGDTVGIRHVRGEKLPPQ